jgi:hypothetical protein
MYTASAKTGPDSNDKAGADKHAKIETNTGKTDPDKATDPGKIPQMAKVLTNPLFMGSASSRRSRILRTLSSDKLAGIVDDKAPPPT